MEQALGAHAFPVAHRVFAGGYLEKYPAGNSRWIAYALTAGDGSGSESGQGDIGTTGFPNRWRGRPQSARIAAARAPIRISVDDAATVSVVASSTVPP